MQAETLPLFDTNKMSIEEMMQYMENLADKKFKDFHISLGYFKTKNFKRTHNAWFIGLNHADKSISQSIDGTSFPNMLQNVIAFIEKA